MLGRFKDILVGDDVDIQCPGSPLMQPNSPVKVFNPGDFLEQLFWSKLGCNLYYTVKVSR